MYMFFAAKKNPQLYCAYIFNLNSTACQHRPNSDFTVLILRSTHVVIILYKKTFPQIQEITFTATIIIYILLTKIPLRSTLHLNAIEQANIIYQNAGILIFPLVQALQGQDYIIYSSAFMTVQLVLLWTHCKGMLCRTEKMDWKKIFLNVNILSILIGLILFLFHVHLPADCISCKSPITLKQISLQHVDHPCYTVTMLHPPSWIFFQLSFPQTKLHLKCFLTNAYSKTHSMNHRI